MREMTEAEIAKAQAKFAEDSDKMSEKDLGENAAKGDAKFKKLESSKPNALTAVWEDLKSLLSLAKDYISGDYRDISWKVIAAVGAAIAYFVSPIDAILDIIPILGYLDDALVIKLCLDLMGDDLAKYRAWLSNKESQKIATEE